MRCSTILFAIAAASILVPSNPADAQQTHIGRLPGNPMKSGFTMTATLAEVAGNGYQPVHLNFAPTGKAFLRDRQLEIVISPRHDWDSDLDFDFRQRVTLPQGTKSFSTVFFVPYYYDWNLVGIELREDGKGIDRGPTRFAIVGLRSRNADQHVGVGILEPRDAAKQDAPWKIYPDVRTLITVLGDGPIPEDVDTDRLTHQAARDLAHNVQPAWVQFRPIPETQLYDDWRGYSQLDVILVAAPLLQRIRAEQPQPYEALKRWAASGGNLWIYAADGAPLAEVVGSFDRTPPQQLVAPQKVDGKLQLNQPNDTSSLTYESWSGVRKQSSTYGYDSKVALSKRSDVYRRLKAKGHSFAETVPNEVVASEFRIGSLGLGKVLAIESADPFPGSFQLWKSIAELHGQEQLQWNRRVGIDVPAGNDNYWAWLIGSVGQPPVKSFVFLNTLFVILIGPVCYFIFRRRGRLFLLYFFAPALALLVTASLFAYALAADGIRTKLRVRQLTWVDADDGVLVGQARQTYYAVLGSRSGLRLAPDVAIYPVRSTPAVDRYRSSRSNSGRHGEYWVDPDEQRLSGSFLPPRTQVQYLIHRPVARQQTLQFSLTGPEPRLTNHLPYRLQRMLVRDSEGRYWVGDSVDSGGAVPLRQSDEHVLGQMIDETVLPSLQTVPELQRNQRWRYNASPGGQVSRLENTLQQWSQRLPPGTFIGLADLKREDFAVEDPIVLDSSHVVMGELP